MSFELRDYQEKISTEMANLLPQRKILYLNGEVRSGKTLIALEVCKKINAKNVLIITKIKAFSSIQNDYNNFGYTFNLTIINKESLHTILDNSFDIVLIDEAHQYAAYPKASKYQKDIRARFGNKLLLLLSGTMSPESFSQIYHQFQLSNYSPFKNYTNFYKFAADYVNVKIKNLGYAKVNDYSEGKEKEIKSIIRHFVFTVTQKDAGFYSKVNELVLGVEMKPITYQIINKLKKDLVVKGASGHEIIADTGAKLLQKVHQLSSGTIKIDNEVSLIIDNSKAVYIAEHFKNEKIAIFYKYVAQLKSLKEVLGDKLTTEIDEFNNTDKWLALQFISGREGVNLSKADALVMIEIDFSATTYFQAKDRMTIKERLENNVFWVFAKNTIEYDIYKRVIQKKHYTTSNFIKDNGVKISNQSNSGISNARLFRFKNY
jgi:superfamily II DNA or RNA helicase